MTEDRERRLDDLFWRAADLTSEEREAFLAEECEDPALRERLEALLAEADETRERDGGYLRSLALDVGLSAEPPPDLDDEGDEPPSRVGQRFGPYRTTQLLGRGGMGAVYLADRVEGDFEQRVAIKVVRRGMESREVVRRLRRERSILARLEHPNIARLFDGGVGPEGQPYLVLEYVDGERITDYCERNALGLGDRLRLFLDVARAVQFAHAKLVVHRDLKPSNVLVTPSGEVKLLDFGISKLLETDEGGDDVTRTGASVLTPAYAAPEQIVGEEVSTATDVFALGVLLYELLGGEHPFRPEEGSNESVADRVLAYEPPPPGPDGAGSTPRDLGLVCLRALRKEADRRYGSAADLARDVERFLAGEPVTARPPTIRYRAGKFVGRHRVAAAASTAAILALVFGLGVALWQARAAATEAARASRINEFVLDLFRASDPDEALGEDLSARDLLDRGARRLEASLEDEPAVRAEMLLVLGTIHRELALYDASRSLLETALRLNREVHGDEARESTAVLHELARLADARKDYLDADSLYRRVLARHEAAGRRGAAQAAQVAGELGALSLARGDLEEAELLLERSVDVARSTLSPTDPALMNVELRYANALHQMERWDEATVVYRSVAERSAALPSGDDPGVAAAVWSFAQQEAARGRRERALPLMRQALGARRRVLGETHPTVMQNTMELAVLVGEAGDFDEAETLLLAALETQLELHGPLHQEVGETAQALGTILARQGKYEAAAARLDQAAGIFESLLGSTHMYTTRTRHNQARTLTNAGRHDEAAEMYRAVLEGYRTLGRDHVFAVQVLVDLSGALLQQGRARDADSIAGEAVDAYARIGRTGVEVGLALLARGRAQRELVAPELAESTLREAIQTLRVAGPDVGLSGELLACVAEVHLADLFLETDRLDEAEPLLLAAYDVISEARPPSHSYHQLARRTLEKLYLARGDPERAARFSAPPQDG